MNVLSAFSDAFWIPFWEPLWGRWGAETNEFKGFWAIPLAEGILFGTQFWQVLVCFFGGVFDLVRDPFRAQSGRPSGDNLVIG